MRDERDGLAWLGSRLVCEKVGGKSGIVASAGLCGWLVEWLIAMESGWASGSR